MVDARGLVLEHLPRLLLHCMRVAQSVHQALLGFGQGPALFVAMCPACSDAHVRTWLFQVNDARDVHVALTRCEIAGGQRRRKSAVCVRTEDALRSKISPPSTGPDVLIALLDFDSIHAHSELSDAARCGAR
jgi:hypothetical protein